MRFTRAGAADQHQIVRRLGKGQIGQLIDQRPIHFGLTEIEARKTPVHGKLSGPHLITDRANGAVGGFGFQQRLDQRFGCAVCPPCRGLCNSV